MCCVISSDESYFTASAPGDYITPSTLRVEMMKCWSPKGENTRQRHKFHSTTPQSRTDAPNHSPSGSASAPPLPGKRTHGCKRSRLQQPATDAERAEGRGGGETGEEEAAVQRAVFYLQRRHDIPCPPKAATERCSPCSGRRRRRSLASSSTGEPRRRVARNPIRFDR